MANVTVSTNPSTTNNTLIVNFTTDATNIVDIQLTKDSSTYISADTFTSTSAKFDVSSWSNGTYNNCHLKVIYVETSSGGSTGGGSTATYTITRNVTNCTSTGGSTIDTSITTTFQSIVTPNDGYTLTTLTVSMGGIDYTNEPNVITDTEWEGKPAKQIIIKNVNGNIVITASATQQETPSGPSDPSAVYDNPSYSVKDYKIILTQDGYKEVFDANDFIYVGRNQNKKEFTWTDGNNYALALYAEDTGSKFRINGMYPSADGYRELKKDSSDEPYDLLDDAFVPTVNNFNFSVGVRNGDLENQHQVDADLLNDCLYTLNCALPALNYHVDSNSANTILLDDYQESWFGLSMTVNNHFLTRLNKSTLTSEYGQLNSSNDSYKAWKSALVHELGHSLGFDDNAVHYPTLYTYRRNRARVNYLQAPDIFTLKSLYKEKYNIDISKSQEDINSQVATLGLGTHTSLDKPSGRILSVHFDYPAYTNNELYDKADLIIEGKLEFDRCESINIGSENSPLILKYNVYKIIPNSVIKGEITNYELKIHISEKMVIRADSTYKLYLKQFENVPCSSVNIEQGIQIKE